MPAATCFYCGVALTPADRRHNTWYLCRACCRWWVAKMDDAEKADSKAWLAFEAEPVPVPATEEP